MLRVWEVIGGVGAGGILVRQGPTLDSPKAATRLSTGARVSELELSGERLHYRLLEGSGPQEGWVATHLSGKQLLARREAQVPCPVPEQNRRLPPELHGRSLEELAAGDAAVLFEALAQAYREPKVQVELHDLARRFGGVGTLSYCQAAQSLVARFQGAALKDSGLQNPLATIASILRCVHRVEQETALPEVLEPFLQTRAMLGFENNDMVPTILEVPFFEQPDSGACGQANLKMIFKYFFPDCDYSYEALNSITGRSEGKWTWSSQVLVALVEEGLDAHFYSTGPWQQILANGEPFLRAHYGEALAEVFRGYTDFDTLYRSIGIMFSSLRYEQRKLAFAEVKQALQRGELVLVAVDYNKITNFRRTGSVEAYDGHFVTLTGVDEASVQFHDTIGVPHRIVDIERFQQAWEALGADNDAIVVRGMLSSSQQRVAKGQLIPRQA